jgi:poly-gamma-glutamate capsule biosynthesis protein CapA/YwtB (metallophosphatase superfamily)
VNLLPLFRDTDLVIFNAEGGLCDPLNGGVVLEPRGSNILWVTPASLFDLQSEIDDTKLVINQANNHSMNLGEPCMQRGTVILSDAGIGVLGVGENLAVAREPYVVEINGTVIGILAYADTNVIIDAWVANSEHSGVVPMDPLILEEDMRALRTDVDFLIVTFHSGKEFERRVTHNQVEFALAAVQQGADVVIGHGSHVPQGVLKIDNTPIYFGLGNGMMDQCFPADYAFYSNDVRKNVWLEVEIKKSELVSTKPHILYSTKCMVPNVAPPLINAEVVHAFENIVFMDDLSILPYFDIHGIVEEVFPDGMVD